jgi:hypothetical protein
VIARRRAAVAIGVVAVLVIAGFLLFGGEKPLIPGGHAGPGEFSFHLAGVQASPVTLTPPPQLKDTAREAGAGIKATMDELYFRAFVDTGSWGDYGAAFELFDGDAQARAEADEEVLTLGATAKDDFETIEGPSGLLTIVVQTNKKDAPVTAIAEVQFQADAQRKDDSTTQISSVGSFFLRQVDGAWKIFAYRVDRDDQAAAAPSSSGSPS